MNDNISATRFGAKVVDEDKAAPVHPGEVLKRDFLEPLGLTPTGLATAIGVTPPRIHEIVHGRRGITPETALRLALYFGSDAESWLNLQHCYDLACLERDMGDALRRLVRPRQAA